MERASTFWIPTCNIPAVCQPCGVVSTNCGFFCPENFSAQSTERLSSGWYLDFKDPDLQLWDEREFQVIKEVLLDFMLGDSQLRPSLASDEVFSPFYLLGNSAAEVLNLIIPGYKGTTYAAFSATCFTVPLPGRCPQRQLKTVNVSCYIQYVAKG